MAPVHSPFLGPARNILLLNGNLLVAQEHGSRQAQKAGFPLLPAVGAQQQPLF